MFDHNQLLLLFFIRYYKYHSHNSFEQNVSELNVIKYLQTRTRFIPPMSLWLREKATLCYNVKLRYGKEIEDGKNTLCSLEESNIG